MRLSRFPEVWCLDTEFYQPPGERPDCLCLVAKELWSGSVIRLWQDELRALAGPPFDTGPHSLCVTYYSPAEWNCFLALGWELPANVLDLYSEFRLHTAGRTVPGHGLIAALTAFNIRHLEDELHKEDMRRLAQSGGPFYAEDVRDLLDYCESDVLATERLLQAFSPFLDLERAVRVRGAYMRAVARMEAVGVPLDLPLYQALRAHWQNIQQELIRRVDGQYGVYDGPHFDTNAFEAYLARQGIDWPRHQSGAPKLDEETFGLTALAWPQLKALHDLRTSLAQLREWKLAVGADGRNRVLLSPFATKTGRNAPSNSQFIFGPSTWLRSLIRPEKGSGLAYLDWSGAEIGIAAALSGDAAMRHDYQSADFYLSFGKRAGILPDGATKTSHGPERDMLKACCLGVIYGMGGEALARRLRVGPDRARELLRLHQKTYPGFWAWSGRVLRTANWDGFIEAAFGWRMHLEPDANPRSVVNFPMQANCAEAMRLAAIDATERGLRLCCPVHDAFVLEAAEDELDRAVAECQGSMEAASKLVLNGFALKSEAKVVRWPGRYADPRGKAMWETVLAILGSQGKGITGATGG
jgi:hypothetical protein